MVLDEALRDRIDEVARRRKNAELMQAGVRGALGMLSAFAVVRICIGLLTGGKGWSLAFLLALAAGITYALGSPRHKHTRLSAARFIDSQLGLEDRLATAVEYATLDNNAGTSVERWLFVDAANQAAFIDPDELVPYRVPKEARWLTPLIIAGLVLSFPVFPRGLSWQIGGAELQQAAKRADELFALAEQIDRLATAHPELRQVAEELRQVGEQLRSKKLPQDEALRLLRELEQEMQQQPAGPLAGAEHATLDIAQIQSLAQRLRRIDGPGQLQGWGRSAGGGSRTGGAPVGTGEYDEYGDYGDGSDYGEPGGESDGYGAYNSSRTGDSGQPGEADTPGNQGAGSSRSGGTAASGGSAGESDEDWTDGEPGSGTSGAGTGAGRGSQQPFERLENVNRELAPIPGQIGPDGKLYSGQAQGNLPSAPEDQQHRPVAAPSSTPAAVERAIEQENVPLAYRQWVKRYFEALEPGAGN